MNWQRIRRLIGWNSDSQRGAEQQLSVEQLEDRLMLSSTSLIDLDPNTFGYSVSEMVELNGKAIFSANSEQFGHELFVSNGTAGGTRLLANILPGRTYLGKARSSQPRHLTVVEDKVYFSAYGERGGELYVTDGTRAGTRMVRNIARGAKNRRHISSSPDSLTEFNGALYFTAYTTEHGRELWTSNGT